jgi:acetyltransferase-like isoleucine patch superfamily enzyme
MSDEIVHFQEKVLSALDLPTNRFHPLVWITGDPDIADDVYIGGFSEVNANGAKVVIEKGCDIASFVSINCADSHKKTIGFEKDISRRDIYIGEHVFIGSHSVIKGGATIGHHSVVAAGTVVDPVEIPPYSLISGNPMTLKPRYFSETP